MRVSEELDIMYKQASALDDHYARVKNGDFNFSTKQKVMTGAGAALGSIGLGLLQNRNYNKAIRNAQEKQENARTERSRKFWENTEARLKKQKKLGVGISAASGAIIGAYGPYMYSAMKNEARRSADWSKSYNKAWEDAERNFNDTWNRYHQQRQRAYEYYRRNYGGSTGHSTTRDISDDFSKFGIKKEQFSSKAEFNKWYKSQARKYHPDLNPNNQEAADMMKKVNNFADNVKKSDWFSKLAFLLNENGIEKQAAPLGAIMGAVKSVAPKLTSMGSKIMSSSAGRAAVKGAASGSLVGAGVGAMNSQPGADGKNHRIKNALKGALGGAALGGAIGGGSVVARTPDFSAKLKSGLGRVAGGLGFGATTGATTVPGATGATVPPIVKPASTTMI